jgi:hypothetical protein
VLRFLVSLLVFVAAMIAWGWLVSAIGIWWTVRHPPAPVPGSDTYSIMSNWVFRLILLVPFALFSAWYWRRGFRRAA